MASAVAARTAAQIEAPAYAPGESTGPLHTVLEMWAALQSQVGSQAGVAAAAEGGPGISV